MGLKEKSTSKHLQITFVGNNGVYSPLFHIKDFEDAKKTLDLHIQKYYADLKTFLPTGSDRCDKNARGVSFEDSDVSVKLDENSNEIKKIRKYLDSDERILYVTRKKQKEEKKQRNSTLDANMILATDKRILITSSTGFGSKDLIKDMPFDSISKIKLQEGTLSSSVVFNGAGFAKVGDISQASLQRSWAIEEETTIGSIPKTDAKELVNILREQIEKTESKILSLSKLESK